MTKKEKKNDEVFLDIGLHVQLYYLSFEKRVRPKHVDSYRHHHQMLTTSIHKCSPIFSPRRLTYVVIHGIGFIKI